MAMYNGKKVLTVVKYGGKTLGVKSITANGEYNASADNVDGYSKVTVNVASVSKLGAAVSDTLEEITAEDLAGATKISQYALSRRQTLKKITLPNSVLSIENYAFGYSKLITVIFGSGITEIKDSAFYNCTQLTGLTIPDNVITIAGSICYECTAMTSLIIGSGVQSIGFQAFCKCSRLQSITIKAITPPTLGSTPFYNTGSGPIYVPAASVEAYKTATNWTQYASRIQAIPE